MKPVLRSIRFELEDGTKLALFFETDWLMNISDVFLIRNHTTANGLRPQSIPIKNIRTTQGLDKEFRWIMRCYWNGFKRYFRNLWPV